MSQPAERVPRRIKFILALGEFAPSVGVGTILPFYFLFFLTDVAHLRPGVAGSILLVARLWDAINDPLVGSLSDRTRSRWGRRRPYMLFGAVPTGVLFALLWLVPPLSDAGRAAYYLIVYLLFDAMFTVVTTPYTALTPELTLDADERTSLITWRMVVSILTGLAAAVAMEFVFSAMDSLQTGFAVVGISVGLIGILPYLWIVAAIRERPEFQGRGGSGFLEGMRHVLRSRPFWLALLADMLAWAAIAVVEGVFAYYLIYWSGIPQSDSPLVMALILASAGLLLPLVGWLADRLEKKWAFVICTGSWALIHVALWMVPQGVRWPVYVIAVLAGLGVAGAHVLPGAMSIDVLEAVELESGRREEGIFLGVGNFVRKLGISLALFALGWALDLTGYVPNAVAQTGGALLGIRVMLSWVPALLLGLAMLSAAAFPITRAVHARMLSDLAARQEAAPGD